MLLHFANVGYFSFLSNIFNAELLLPFTINNNDLQHNSIMLWLFSALSTCTFNALGTSSWLYMLLLNIFNATEYFFCCMIWVGYFLNGDFSLEIKQMSRDKLFAPITSGISPRTDPLCDTVSLHVSASPPGWQKPFWGRRKTLHQWKFPGAEIMSQNEISPLLLSHSKSLTFLRSLTCPVIIAIMYIFTTRRTP